MAGVSGVKLKFETWFRMHIHVNQIQELYALGFPVESQEPDYILVDQLRDLRIHVYDVRDLMLPLGIATKMLRQCI